MLVMVRLFQPRVTVTLVLEVLDSTAPPRTQWACRTPPRTQWVCRTPPRTWTLEIN